MTLLTRRAIISAALLLPGCRLALLSNLLFYCHAVPGQINDDDDDDETVGTCRRHITVVYTERSACRE